MAFVLLLENQESKRIPSDGQKEKEEHAANQMPGQRAQRGGADKTKTCIAMIARGEKDETLQ